MCKYTEI